MTMTLILALTTLVSAATIGVIAVVRRRERLRTLELGAAAARVGWAFRESVPFETLPDLDRFELFKSGHSRKLANVMTSPPGDVRAVLFDYSYTVGGGKNQSSYHQTVFYGVCDALDLPSFSLRPQHFGHAIAKVFGYRDIDLADRPVFSDMFVLRGEEVEALRAQFNADPVASFFEEREDVCGAGLRTEVLLWRSNRRTEPAVIESLMTEGFELVGRLRDDAAR